LGQPLEKSLARLFPVHVGVTSADHAILIAKTNFLYFLNGLALRESHQLTVF